MMTFTYIVAVLGYWGRGETIKEAAESCKKWGGKNKDSAAIWVVTNDLKPYIDSNGRVCRDAKSDIDYVGKGLKLGQLLKVTQ